MDFGWPFYEALGHSSLPKEISEDLSSQTSEGFITSFLRPSDQQGSNSVQKECFGNEVVGPVLIGVLLKDLHKDERRVSS